MYWFCHTSTWIRHRYAHVPHPEPPPTSLPVPSLWVLPVHQPQASSIHASNLDWWFISYKILYMFQCQSPKSSHPLTLLQSSKHCSIYLCLFCCLPYHLLSRLPSAVIITIYLNSMYDSNLKRLYLFESHIQRIYTLEDVYGPNQNTYIRKMDCILSGCWFWNGVTFSVHPFG